MDWFGAGGRAFSLSVRGDGRIAYAARLGTRRGLMAWTSFLTKLLQRWRPSSTKLSASVEPKRALSNLTLGRFIDDKRNVSPTGRVKRRAFEPPSINLNLSVYKLNDLAENQVWDIGDQFVASIKGRPILGRADVFEAALRPLALRAVADPVPHPNHMNIVGWPADKDRRISVALDLAEQSTSPKPH